MACKESNDNIDARRRSVRDRKERERKDEIATGIWCVVGLRCAVDESRPPAPFSLFFLLPDASSFFSLSVRAAPAVSLSLSLSLSLSFPTCSSRRASPMRNNPFQFLIDLSSRLNFPPYSATPCPPQRSDLCVVRFRIDSLVLFRLSAITKRERERIESIRGTGRQVFLSLIFVHDSTRTRSKWVLSFGLQTPSDFAKTKKGKGCGEGLHPKDARAAYRLCNSCRRRGDRPRRDRTTPSRRGAVRGGRREAPSRDATARPAPTTPFVEVSSRRRRRRWQGGRR